MGGALAGRHRSTSVQGRVPGGARRRPDAAHAHRRRSVHSLAGR